jgi:hypothetical protein
MTHSAPPDGVPNAARGAGRSASELVARAAAILARETRADRGAPVVGESRIAQLIAQYPGEDVARNLSEAAALVVAWRRAAAPSAAGTSAVIPRSNRRK